MEIIIWPSPSSKDRERFLKFCVIEDSGCIDWSGVIDKYGYGDFWWSGVNWGAHRVALIWASQCREHKGLSSLHSCGNRACVNTEHLRWGTAKDNSLDSDLHGTIAHGERIRQAKLSKARAISIYKSYHEDGFSASRLALIHQVSKHTIQQVATGSTWRRATTDIELSKKRKVHNGRYIKIGLLDDGDVKKIWSMWHESGLTIKAIAESFSVSVWYISAIMQKRLFRHITADLPETRIARKQNALNGKETVEKRGRKRLSKQEIEQIFAERHGKGTQQNILAHSLGVHPFVIGGIEKRTRYRKITKDLVCPNSESCSICKRLAER